MVRAALWPTLDPPLLAARVPSLSRRLCTPAGIGLGLLILGGVLLPEENIAAAFLEGCLLFGDLSRLPEYLFGAILIVAEGDGLLRLYR